MNRVVLHTPYDVLSHCQTLSKEPLPLTVQWKQGDKRSMSQNGLFHAWMGQIAKATNDTPSSVKAECHIQWGIPLFRAEDHDYAEFIVSALGGRARGKVKEMIEKDFIPCTRIMPKPILADYMNAVWREYAPHVQLMDPEDLKWRSAA